MRTFFDGLSALREPRARVAKARNLLSEAAPERATLALHHAIVRARGSGCVQSAAALDAVAVALTRSGGIDYQTTSALYSAAKAKELSAVARLFLNASPRAASAPAPYEDLQEERPAHPRGSPLPLGTRKWLARRSRKDALTALARDPHPDVIDSLLTNPAMTERDVLAIASRRPTQPESQVVIFSNDTWRVRHAVRRALALNPHTPVPLTARIMIALRDRDLREIASDPGLSPTLRTHAEELEALGRSARA